MCKRAPLPSAPDYIPLDTPAEMAAELRATHSPENVYGCNDASPMDRALIRFSISVAQGSGSGEVIQNRIFCQQIIAGFYTQSPTAAPVAALCAAPPICHIGERSLTPS